MAQFEVWRYKFELTEIINRLQGIDQSLQQAKMAQFCENPCFFLQCFYVSMLKAKCNVLVYTLVSIVFQQCMEQGGAGRWYQVVEMHICCTIRLKIVWELAVRQQITILLKMQ